MKDNQEYDAAKYHWDNAKTHFDNLVKKTFLAPQELIERVQADLASMGQYIAYQDRTIRINQVEFTGSGTKETVVRDFDGDDDDLYFGLSIERYHVRTRLGWQIKVNEYQLRRYCERFSLYKDFGYQKFVDAVKPKLEREEIRPRKPLSEGQKLKSRPRVFKELENAKRLIEKTLLKLKLVEPLAGIEEMPANYIYDN